MAALLAACALFVGFLFPAIILDGLEWGEALRASVRRSMRNPAAPTTLMILVFVVLALAFFAIALVGAVPTWGIVALLALGYFVGLGMGLVWTPAQ